MDSWTADGPPNKKEKMNYGSDLSMGSSSCKNRFESSLSLESGEDVDDSYDLKSLWSGTDQILFRGI